MCHAFTENYFQRKGEFMIHNRVSGIWVDPRKSILCDSTKLVSRVCLFNVKKCANGDGAIILNHKHQESFYSIKKGKLMIVDCSPHRRDLIE